MAMLRITGLPAAPLDAAAAFHGEWLAKVRAHFNPPPLGEVASRSDDGGGPLRPTYGVPPPPEGENLIMIFPPADHTHRAWRLAAVQELAREFAPRRVNALACDDEQGLSAALALLEPCHGITGQLLALDGTGVV